ncbi:MAG: hypothetical protein ACKVPX_01050 [Myxococcaceae bacterium]
MSIQIDPDTEMQLRNQAKREGLTVEAYLARLARADQRAEDELESLALEGLASGEPIEVAPGYWEEKHRRLDEQLKAAAPR